MKCYIYDYDFIVFEVNSYSYIAHILNTYFYIILLPCLLTWHILLILSDPTNRNWNFPMSTHMYSDIWKYSYTCYNFTYTYIRLKFRVLIQWLKVITFTYPILVLFNSFCYTRGFDGIKSNLMAEILILSLFCYTHIKFFFFIQNIQIKYF